MSASSVPVVETKGILKSYGNHQVLKGVNMQVNKGDIYGLVGKNGCGKTTLFKLILGLSDFQGGTLSIFGGKGAKQNCERRSRIGFFVGNNFFDYLSGRENLNYFRQLKGIKDKSEIDRVLELVKLNKKASNSAAKGYSMGMKQRLGIANALLGNPELIILDEPINGLDPQGIADIRNLITQMNEENGTTFIISSHILSELEHTAHRFGIVDEGVIMRELSAEELQTQSGVTSIEVRDEDAERAQQILAQNNIPVQGVTKASESLEELYFATIGGGKE